MNSVNLIGRVVKTAKLEEKKVYKVRIASNTPSGTIFITAFVYSEEVPAEKGDLVFVSGELRPIGDTGGLYISADRFARLKRARSEEQPEQSEKAVEEEVVETAEEGTESGESEEGEETDEITEEDIKRINF